MTLNEVMKDTADAIREKTGKSELIKPVDFASEIKGISAGGGGDAPSGGSSWKYFDVRNMDENKKNTVCTLSQFCRYFKYVDMVSPVQMAKDMGVTTNEIQYVCIDLAFELLEETSIITVEQMLGNYGVLGDLLTTEITEAEFYDLNA